MLRSTKCFLKVGAKCSNWWNVLDQGFQTHFSSKATLEEKPLPRGWTKSDIAKSSLHVEHSRFFHWPVPANFF